MVDGIGRQNDGMGGILIHPQDGDTRVHPLNGDREQQRGAMSAFFSHRGGATRYSGTEEWFIGATAANVYWRPGRLGPPSAGREPCRGHGRRRRVNTSLPQSLQSVRTAASFSAACPTPRSRPHRSPAIPIVTPGAKWKCQRRRWVPLPFEHVDNHQRSCPTSRSLNVRS